MESALTMSVGVIVQDEKVLLGYRGKHRARYPDCWAFFGGHCKEEENYEETLKREIKEELGIEVIEFKPLQFFDYSPDIKFLVFLVSSWEGLISNAAPLEHDLIQWFTLNEARELKLASTSYQIIFDLLEEYP